MAYTDRDNDAFYSIGEGLSGVRFTVDSARGTTAGAGGYTVSASSDVADVAITQGAATLGSVSVDMAAGNVKVDLVVGRGGDYALALSGDATLGDGIDDAHLLGAGHLDLAGNNADNVLTGNRGNNILSGGDGHDRLVGGDQGDRLFGGTGRDVLIGGKGYDVLVGGNFNDRLYGGTGNDKLYGGAGNDYTVAGTGHDRLFGNNGHDRLFGNGGADRLAGGNGNDLLNGGAGNDLLIGGNGADRFVFTAGQDRVWDFEDDVDTIIISSRLTGDATIAELIDGADIVNGNAFFDFGNGNTLTLRNITDADILADDLNIV